MQDVCNLGEKQLLGRLQKYLGKSPQIVRTFSEDCAVLKTDSDEYQLITVDTLVENVHFSQDYVPAFYLGKKAIKVNLSDISAMGGTPLYYMVSIGVPPATQVSTIESIYDGMADASKENQIRLIGGNVCSSNALFIDVVMIGKAEPDEVLFRDRAAIGDSIFVTGRLGAAAEGLKLLKDGFRLLGDGIKLPENQRDSRYVRDAVFAHLDPPNLNSFARKVGKSKMVNSMIDLSDGLASDLAEICRESKTGARIDFGKIPVAPSALHWERKRGLNPFHLALSGGEDYHLLFTVSRSNRKKFMDHTRKAKMELFEIGEICRSSDGVLGIDENGKECSLGSGYEHFVTKQ